MDHSCILCIEDNSDDVLLLKYALERAGVANRITTANGGQEAIDYLSGINHFRDRRRYPLPWLVILDWKLPGMTGLEVLKWVRGQRRFAGVKVVVFSGSDRAEDFIAAREAGADGYFLKPCDLNGTEDFARMVATLPSVEPGAGWMMGMDRHERGGQARPRA